MENTYTVRGTDGREYGPVTLSQVVAWIREGRLNGQSELRRSDLTAWARATDFSELQAFFASAAPQPIAPPASAGGVPAATASQLKSGASWFYWIAGLSLVNSIAATWGSDWRFIVGLGVTQIVDAVGAEIANGGRFVALALDLMVAGVFVLFGVFAHKRHLWAFIVGMILFGLDGLVFLLGRDWIGVGFHVFVLFCLFRGCQACRALAETRA
ncbi:MAG TPA: DUF4339 domain-containing protein [Verrucomicrobiae bacterium]|nr:DUF4339 domain-containing protein [Verrucomicrobiae bacterium]